MISRSCIFLFSRFPIVRGPFHYRKSRVVPEDEADPLVKPMAIDKSTLHIVSVPIGNLKDFTYRAVDVLKQVDYIITSNRPATKTLLDLVRIPSQGRLIHYSAQNQAATTSKLVEMLQGGHSMALVTTSGTPCVGDVGAELVQAMHRSGVRVTAVPGASAVLAALVCCGETQSLLECRGEDHGTHVAEAERGIMRPPPTSPRALEHTGMQFFFGNVLPTSQTARLRMLKSVVCPAAHICLFYEIPRRLLIVLEDIAFVMPTRRVYITHELTRVNESFHADRADRLASFYRRNELTNSLLKQGQLVIAIAGCNDHDHHALDSITSKQKACRGQWLSNTIDRAAAPLNELLREQKETTIPQKTVPDKVLKKRKRKHRYKKRLRLLKNIALEQEKLRLLAVRELAR